MHNIRDIVVQNTHQAGAISKSNNGDRNRFWSVWTIQTACSSHVFCLCFTAAVGGKRDRQIYRIDFTFNLRQTEKEEEIVLQLHCCLSLQRKIKIPVAPRVDKNPQKLTCDSVSAHIKHLAGKLCCCPSFIFVVMLRTGSTFFGKYADLLSAES